MGGFQSGGDKTGGLDSSGTREVGLTDTGASAVEGGIWAREWSHEWLGFNLGEIKPAVGQQGDAGGLG